MTQQQQPGYGYSAEDVRLYKQGQKFLKMYAAEKVFIALSLLVAIASTGMLYLGRLDADMKGVIYTSSYLIIGTTVVLGMIFGVGAISLSRDIKNKKATRYAFGLILLGIITAVGYYFGLPTLLDSWA